MKKLSSEDFIRKSKNIHGNKYDYSKVRYDTNKKKVSITCFSHGEFLQRPNEHLNGCGCPTCASIQRPISKTLSQSDFVKKCKDIHGDRYDYSKCIYTHNQDKVELICKVHGSFKATALDHQQGSGCPNCNLSRGEVMVGNWLKGKNIKFEIQKKFDLCRNPKTNRKLSFDFYLPQLNILIEVDGAQHYPNAVGRFIGRHKISVDDYEKIRFKDNFKNNYAKSSNIKLLRIPYITRKSIVPILETNIY